MMKTISNTVLIVLLGIFASACTDVEGPADDNFDRPTMLAEIADNTIIPGYASVLSDAITLQQAVDDFAAVPSQQNLETCQQAWRKVALAWQHVVIFDFGPAEGLFGNLAENVATFPASEEAIESKITASNVDHTDFARHTRGLYAIEYLLYCDNKQPVVAGFTGDAAQQRFQYLRSIVQHLVAEITRVLSEWTDGYRATFVSQTGTDVGSGVGLLFNNLARGYELLKNYKVALPLGKIAGQASTEPTKVEAFYSGMSIELMNAHYNAVMDLWHGRTPAGSRQLGFKDYLMSVTGGERLVNDTEEQERAVRSQLATLGTEERLSTIIEQEASRVEPLQVETQKMTRFLKSELSSLLGLSITFSSGDGD